MSESGTTRSKSATETDDTESTENPLVADRWSNNISYRQLVVSSCIGIVQLWWHPYLYDLSKLIPFLFLYNVFSVCIGYPLFYLELALGVVTKKGVIDCWDLAPMARGVGFTMLTICMFTALALGVVAAWSLALFVHSFHSFLPWLHCAATAKPACTARHRPLSPGSETPAHSFFLNLVLHLKRQGLETGLGTVVWELTIYYIISWILIYFITIKRIYSISKLVLFKDLLAYFVLTCCAFGVVRLDGAGRMFHECDWSALFSGFKLWREAIEYALIEMTISQGSLIMLGAYCPKQQHKLATTALLAFGASKSSSVGAALVLGAAHGALHADYDNKTNIWSGPTSSMVIWADYVARIPGSQFWSAVLFFTLFVLSLSSVALLVQTMLSTFTGRSIRKIAWVFLIINCILFSLLGAITLCTQGGLYVLDFLMTWPVTKPRVPVAAVVAMIITYVYGQTTFCEDVYFAVGEYPCVFIRVCWALSPGLLMIMFVTPWPAGDAATFGWVLVVLSLVPVLAFMAFYLVFRCRVRNIVGNVK